MKALDLVGSLLERRLHHGRTRQLRRERLLATEKRPSQFTATVFSGMVGSRLCSEVTVDRTLAVDKLSVLGKHEFFRDLPRGAIEQMAARARTVEYLAGKRIFSKGEEGYGLLAVLSGAVKISVQSPEGREIVLNILGPNQVFGEIALLDRGARTADATALTKASIVILDRRDFLPLIEQEPKIAVRLLATLARRLRRTSEQVEDLSFENTRLRLAKAFMRLAEVQGVARSDSPRILITQKALGQTVGLSRESINKHLQGWKKAGLITLDKGSCTLLQPDRIRHFARATISLEVD